MDTIASSIPADINTLPQSNGVINVGTSDYVIQSYIPDHVTPGSWQEWNSTTPCPAGYTCAELGDESLGAFSCDEMARIAVEEFGFGNVLAGTWCPEGNTSVLNCKVGGYCPDTETRIECPAGMYCPYKTYNTSFAGGGVPCDRCPAGAEEKRLSESQRKVQIAIFVILLLLLVIKIVKRKANVDREMLKNKLHLDSLKRGKADSEDDVQAVKREQAKYSRLRPKLEVIADRLGKIQDDPQDMGGTLSGRSSILFISESGDIMFDANEFFDVLDKNGDGVLSFAEINMILCLSDEQLEAFVDNMRGKMPPGYKPAEHDKVARATFVRCFIDALADASQLQPTPKEAEELFDRIAEEVGTSESGEIPYETLYSSSLSTFLRDSQIFGIISRFKQEGKQKGIDRDAFVKFYPIFLKEVIHSDFRSTVLGSSKELESEQIGGLDVAFENLCLTVKVGKKEVNVVDNVTGRLRSNTMTAVMGGSGSGKSSLLNALCGRAFYGRVTGTVTINGNDTLIEEHKAVIGFVPQDDIVSADLTVRENLLYAGRLQLPAGTKEEEISELAESTMASLGLSRIANSLVGDATRRGVSGGEKKRVNIGIELMKRPRILFLDEPTSGLDSRSAFVVMDSLKRLSVQGMTVASVIHQPRRDIYDLFDSLLLLGVGGRTVYAGLATQCRAYFENLSFQLPEGESQADFFLDISSGEIEPGGDIECGTSTYERRTSSRATFGSRFEVALEQFQDGIGIVLGQLNGFKRGGFVVEAISRKLHYVGVAERHIRVGDRVIGINGRGVGQMTLEEAKSLLSQESTGESNVVFVQITRVSESEDAEDAAEDNGESIEKFHLLSDKSGNEDGAMLKARIAREKLYRQWTIHFDNIPSSYKEEFYSPPTAFALPTAPKAVPGWRQLFVQLRRNGLLSWRNRDSRLIDFGIVVVAIFALSLLGGVKPSTWNSDPTDLFWVKFIASKEDASSMLSLIFLYAFKGVNAITNYALMVGLIVSVMIGLNGAKILTDNRLEFYREAQSGANVTAFYIAASITATVEQGFTAVIGSVLAYLVLKPSTSYLVFLWNFFMLSWLSVSWSLLISITVPLQSVTIVVGFFNAFFGLLFCGKIAPGTYKNLYENSALAVFSAFFSPLRFFVEGIAVSESACLPNQSGYTVGSSAFSYPEFEEKYPLYYDLTYMAHTDMNSAIDQSCDGWFWWVPAAFAVGFTIRLVGGISIHFSGRSKQGKKSFGKEVIDDFHKCREGTKSIFQSFILHGILVSIVFAGLLALSCWLILRVNPEQIKFSES